MPEKKGRLSKEELKEAEKLDVDEIIDLLVENPRFLAYVEKLKKESIDYINKE